MNKRALLGKLILLAIVVVMVMGVTVYFTFTKTGLSLQTGDVKFSVDYEPEDETIGTIVEIDQEGNIIEESETLKESGEDTATYEEAQNEELENLANGNTEDEEELSHESNETENNNTLIDNSP